MASYQCAESVNIVAGEDLRADIYNLLTVENDGGVGKVIKTTAANQVAIGVLAEDPRSDVSTDGLGVPVALLKGVIPMVAAGTITAGEVIIASTTAGAVESVANLAAMTAGDMALGVALQSAVSGDIFEVLAMPVSGD